LRQTGAAQGTGQCHMTQTKQCTQFVLFTTRVFPDLVQLDAISQRRIRTLLRNLVTASEARQLMPLEVMDLKAWPLPLINRRVELPIWLLFSKVL